MARVSHGGWSALAIIALLGPATADACTPLLGSQTPTLEQRYERAHIVALVRVKERHWDKGELTARVEVVESFKGPVAFDAVTTSGSTCAMRLTVDEESIVFLDARRVGMAGDSILEAEIAKALPALRRMKSAR
jgi:hypothetical protein